MSIILGIDTSGTDLGIGIYGDGKPIAAYSRFIGNSHAEHITPVIKAILDANEINALSITHIAVAVGPGSFTGLRIGIAFVKGFAAGCGAIVHPVSSLLILAHAALPLRGTIVAAIDARNNDVYTASFHSDGKTLGRITGDTLLTFDAFRETLTDDTSLVSDKLGNQRSTVFNGTLQVATHLTSDNTMMQRGLICAGIGNLNLDVSEYWKSSFDVHPEYLRKSTPELRNPESLPQ